MQDRTELLTTVAVALGSAGTVGEVARSLVTTLAPAFCDGCEIVLADADGRLHRVTAGPGATDDRERVAVPDDPDHPARRVMATGEVMTLDANDPTQAAALGPVDVPTSARALGVRAAVLAPMTGRSEVLGVLAVAHGPSGRSWSPADRDVVVGVARLTALAVENLRRGEELEGLLERQRYIARTLQASLLPTSLPAVPGVELAAHYWPASDDIDVGGDFYDVFALDEERWALVVGDVCGKGVEAAAVTATARHTLRAAALHGHGPVDALLWVHEALRALEQTFCTIALASWEPRSGRFTTTLGGHAPGIVVRRAGSVERLGHHGTLLGLVPPQLRTHETTLAAGDLVAIFTDGLTDAPAAAALTDQELEEVLRAKADAPLDVVGAELHQALDDRRHGDGARDDVALLLLRVGEGPAA